MADGYRAYRALFTLEPLNHNARAAYSAGFDRGSDIEIGLEYSRAGNTTLATIGRGVECDVIIDHSFISRVQCSFEINPANGLITLVDRSRTFTTAVGGGNSTGFLYSPQREVVVLPGFNDTLYFGSERECKFHLKWEMQASAALKHAKQFANSLQPESVHRARTIDRNDAQSFNRIGADAALTAVQSRALSRICTPNTEPQELRWHIIDHISKSSYGTISRAANVYTSGLIAVKSVRKASLDTNTNLRQIEKQMEFLRDKSHEHIVGIIKVTGWRDETIKIAMELKDGNLDSLIGSWRSRKAYSNNIDRLGLKAMHHALLGWKWLHGLRLIHGSVAPHNILFTQIGDDFSSINSFHFVLADFSLSTADPKAEHNQIYAAPERHYPNKRITDKSDIWSLYVTMLMVLQVDDIGLEIRTYDMDAHFSVITEIARNTQGLLKNLHVMARQNEEERWSANEILDHFFRLGNFLNRPLPPPDQLHRDKRRYCPNSYVSPKKTLTRQSTMEKLKKTGDNILRRITGDISDAVAGSRMSIKQYY